MLATFMAAIDVTAGAVPAILFGDARMLDPSRQALTAIGARVVEERGWSTAPSDVTPAIRPIFVVEAQGVPPEVLEASLPSIRAAAEAIEAPMVVALPEDAIDLVATTMLGPRAQLLCEPTSTERVAALALAARALGHLPIRDRTYEGEAARLQRLNEEVARIAEVLSRISQREGGEQRRAATQVSDRRQVFGIEPMRDIAIDPAEIRRAIRGRRMRDQFFGTGLFEEPGWDIILDLFAAELEHTRVSVSSLCIAAAVAPTTALRWISKLTEAGLLQRQADPFDRRRAYMELSERAGQAMRDYVGAMRRAGLSLA